MREAYSAIGRIDSERLATSTAIAQRITAPVDNREAAGSDEDASTWRRRHYASMKTARRNQRPGAALDTHRTRNRRR